MNNEIEFKFGDYAIIEQKRHGVPNEMFVHKVIDQLRSNTWVDVPVQSPATETIHDEMEDVCLCICCGVDETEVRRYRVKDMRRHSPVSAVTDEKKGSTITLQAVNELIASLENAGELSIREQKFLKLAKEFRICSASLYAAIKTGNMLADQNAQLAAENVALALENVAMKQIVDSVTNLDNEPQYHAEGMGCGLEDRGITDRYDACRYGWDEAMEQIYGEVIPCAEELDFPATDRILAGIKAEAKSHDLNAFISHYSAELDNHIANGGDQFDERAVSLRSVIVGARMFREKLRDEEKALALREGADK